MPVYKDDAKGTWYVMARYINWQGVRKQKCKRGFATKREAQEWERTFQQQNAADMDMTFEAFTELYEKDIRPRLKENTWLTKEHIIKTKGISTSMRRGFGVTTVLSTGDGCGMRGGGYTSACCLPMTRSPRKRDACDGRDGVLGGGKITVATVATVAAKVSAGCRVAFTKGGPAGESTAVDRGSAPPGVSGRVSGQILPAAPSESPRHFAALGLKVS